MSTFGLSGRSVLITSGPTREYLDPIRFLSNASSGAMGLALARAAREKNAEVTLVSGPCALPFPAGVKVISVLTGLEMHREVLRRASSAALVIGAAAVSDWRFSRRAEHKIKRGPGSLRLTLQANPDIIKDAAARRRPGQIFIGFALETRRVVDNARRKLRSKKLDLVVANGPQSLASGHARVRLVTGAGVPPLVVGTKLSVARRIIREAEKLLER